MYEPKLFIIFSLKIQISYTNRKKNNFRDILAGAADEILITLKNEKVWKTYPSFKNYGKENFNII